MKTEKEIESKFTIFSVETLQAPPSFTQGSNSPRANPVARQIGIR